LGNLFCNLAIAYMVAMAIKMCSIVMEFLDVLQKICSIVMECLDVIQILIRKFLF
jgi:glutaminase